jgi:hypothetical protein
MNNNLLGYIFISISTITLFIIFPALYVYFEPETRDKFNCTKQINNSFVFVVDKTDNFSINFKNKIKALFIEKANNMKKNDMLSIYFIDDEISFYEQEPVFKRCSSGRGDNASWLTQNPTMIEAKNNRMLMTPLEVILTQVVKDNKSDSSPIIENIVQLSQSLANDYTNLKVILISDLLQNSNLFTSYKGYYKGNFTYRKNIINDIDVSGFNIKAYVIHRKMHATRQKVIIKEFWQELFDRKNIPVEFDYEYLH